MRLRIGVQACSKPRRAKTSNTLVFKFKSGSDWPSEELKNTPIGIAYWATLVGCNQQWCTKQMHKFQIFHPQCTTDYSLQHTFCMLLQRLCSLYILFFVERKTESSLLMTAVLFKIISLYIHMYNSIDFDKIYNFFVILISHLILIGGQNRGQGSQSYLAVRFTVFFSWGTK